MQAFLDAIISRAYNPSYSEGVSVRKPDREGDTWWKSPQGNSAEVV
jgi:hypothetical protein